MAHATPSFGSHLTEPAIRPQSVLWLSEATKTRNVASFPPFVGERIYMHPFLMVGDQPALLFPHPETEARWLPTVTAMMTGIHTKETCFLMVDQSTVKRGAPHRRPGRHIDGNWIADRGTKDTMTVSLGPHLDLILLASDVQGCAVWNGPYNPRNMGEGGDCERIGVSKMTRSLLAPNVCYQLNAVTIHESIPLSKSGNRTLVRINVPKGAKLKTEAIGP